MFTSFDLPPGFLPSQDTANSTPGAGAMQQTATHDTTGQAQLATLDATDKPVVSPAVGIMRWVIAWAVVIMVLALLNRTRLGHTLIYYALALMLLLLLVTQYKWLANVLQPITGKDAGSYTDPNEEPGATRGHSTNIPQIAQSESGAISQ